MLDDDLMKEVIQELITESNEGLDQMEGDLLAMERNEHDDDAIARIFRVIHAIKGSSGSIGFDKLSKLAHHGESALDKVRSNELEATPELITLVFKMMDGLRAIFVHVEATGDEGDTDYTELQNAFDNYTPNGDIEKKEEEEATTSNPSPKEEGWGLYEDDKTTPPVSTALKPTTDQTPPPPAHIEAGKSITDASASIRVDVKQLDTLMNMIGELVLTRNQIIQQTSSMGDDFLKSTAQRLNSITTELQQNMMKTRMQPVGNAWTKFPRIVRDMAGDLGKKIRLEMDGQETELDRTLIDAIRDPLIHIVRNSVDHGIESPQVREANGKSSEGILTLSAYHESGQVNIEISDDGGGINVGKVKEKAVTAGILTQDKADKMDDREAANFVFHAGFSTADQVSNVSGRGVGMDVVRSNVERIGGSVELTSSLGKGTNIKIKIPLTLAIIPGLLISSGNERFAIPQMSLLELVRLNGANAIKGIEDLCGKPVYRMRGDILPIVFLNKELGLPERPKQKNIEDEELNLIILQSDGKTFGLVVDEINDSEEIVVKPLGRQLQGLSCYAGATIMGDGRIALILDIQGIAHISHAITNTSGQDSSKNNAHDDATSSEKDTLLMFIAGKTSRMALPLALVSRIEEIKREKIQSIRKRMAVQYRGKILRLFDIADIIPNLEKVDITENETIQLIVYSAGEESVGIIVSEILDIIEHDRNLTQNTETEGISGSFDYDDKIIEMLDVEAVMRIANPEMFEDPNSPKQIAG